MFEGKKVVVVVPCYNEERMIAKTLKGIPSFVDYIYVVDDKSTDKTIERIEEHLKTDTRITLIRHEENGGVGKAIASGYKKAVEEDMELVAVMAGDGQMDPCDLSLILTPVAKGEVDYAKGNRLFRGDSWRMIPHYRYLGNSFLSLLTKIASGYWHIADSQSGYTAISKKALKSLELDSIYPRYGMPNDLLIKLNINNIKVRDIPVRPIYTEGDKSGIRLRKVVPIISFLLLKGFIKRLFIKYVIRDFHPLIFFYALGLALFPVGLIFGTYLFLYRILSGPVSPTSALFAAFLFISGLQTLLFAMWFDMEYNRNLR